MIPFSSIDEKVTPDPAAATRLYQAALGAVMAATAYFLWRSGGDLSLPFVLGLAIFYLSAAPALLWAKNRSSWFPAFEITRRIHGQSSTRPPRTQREPITRSAA